MIREFVEAVAAPGATEQLDPRRRADDAACCICRRRSVSATPAATSRSCSNCAGRDRIWTIDWLAQDPVTRVLEAAGERVHPASRRICSASPAHIEAEAGEHDLHAFEAIRRMDEILVANFMLFDEIDRERPARSGDRRRSVGGRLLPAREPRTQALRRSRG